VQTWCIAETFCPRSEDLDLLPAVSLGKTVKETNCQSFWRSSAKEMVAIGKWYPTVNPRATKPSLLIVCSGSMRSIRQVFAAVWRRGSQIGQQQIRCRANCHGAHAEWLSVFPRLAGHRAPYLLPQMLVIQKVMRPAPVMRARSDP